MKRFLSLAAFVVAAVCACAQSLNVASYNVRLLTDADYKSGNGWSQRVDCLCDVIRFSDFDIFGAQEVKYEQLSDMLYRLQDYDYVGVGRDDGAQGGEYSPVFYKKERFTLLDSGTFWLSETPDKVSKGWDARHRRVCSWGYFKDKVSRRKFWFFNLHMDHIGKQARVESALLVQQKMKEIGENLPAILTGDFNVDQTHRSYLALTESGTLRDAFEVADLRYATNGTFNGFDSDNYTESRIDHVFVTPTFHILKYGVLTDSYRRMKKDDQKASVKDCPEEISIRSYESRIPSDHFPVMVKLEACDKN